MQLQFSLDTNDLLALSKYQIENSPKYLHRYRIQRFGILASFLAVALVALFLLDKTSLALYAAALGLVMFGLYPFYYRWIIRNTLHRIIQARKNTLNFDSRIFRLISEGMEVVTNDRKSIIRWSSIGPVMITPKHAFISINGVYTHAIPRDKLEESSFNQFIDTLRARLANYDASNE
jgi:hypothetical protein